jgi:hypothetical protein
MVAPIMASLTVATPDFEPILWRRNVDRRPAVLARCTVVFGYHRDYFESSLVLLAREMIRPGLLCFKLRLEVKESQSDPGHDQGKRDDRRPRQNDSASDEKNEERYNRDDADYLHTAFCIS